MLLTVLNVVLALLPTDVIAEMQMTVIRLSVIAYSTEVGPSSAAQNLHAHRFKPANIMPLPRASPAPVAKRNVLDSYIEM